MMNKELLTDNCEKINHIFEQMGSQRITVTDGVIDIDRYFDAKPRILWVLKEANSNAPENWSYLDAFRNEVWLKQCSGMSVFKRMMYASYGMIYLGNRDWSDIPWYYDDEARKVLLDIALINIKKNPGGNISYDGVIQAAFNDNKELIMQQFEAYDPDVVIFGNTLKYFIQGGQHIIDESTSEEATAYGNHYYRQGGRLYINTRHPAFRGNDKDYVMDLVNIVRDWKNKK